MKRPGTTLAALIFTLTLASSGMAFAGYQQFGLGSHSVLGKFNYYKLSTFIGQDLRAPDGKILGRVQDVIVGNNGNIDYLVISSDLPAAADKLIVIPWRAVEQTSGGDALVANISESQLNMALSFDRNNGPGFSSSQGNQGAFGYYGEDTQQDSSE